MNVISNLKVLIHEMGLATELGELKMEVFVTKPDGSAVWTSDPMRVLKKGEEGRSAQRIKWKKD